MAIGISGRWASAFSKDESLARFRKINCQLIRGKVDVLLGAFNIIVAVQVIKVI